MVPVIVFGLAGSVYLWRFQGYRRIYKELLSDNNIFFGYSEAVRQANIDTFQKKQLDSSVKVNSNKSGYGCLLYTSFADVGVAFIAILNAMRALKL